MVFSELLAGNLNLLVKCLFGCKFEMDASITKMGLNN